MNQRIKKNSQKKYKQTLKLVRIARTAPHNSMSQKEIAGLCGVSQPMVSKWESGDALATTEKIKPLLEKYGDLLPKVSRGYWSPWQIEEGVIHRFEQAQLDSLKPGEKCVLCESGLTSAFRRYHYRVEGHVILSFVCEADTLSQYTAPGELLPLKKVVIHHQGAGHFRLVELCRLFSTSGYSPGTSEPLPIPVNRRPWVLSKLHKPLTANELVKQLDDCANKWIKERIDAYDLPMKVRKSLLDNGFPVSDVQLYPATG